MSFFVRRAMRLPQIRSQVASITQRRGLANATGKDGTAKVHFWKHDDIGLVSLLFTFPIFIYYNHERFNALAAQDQLQVEKQRRMILESLKEALFEK